MITTRQPLLVMLFLLGDVIAYCVLLYTTGLEQKKSRLELTNPSKTLTKRGKIN